MFDEKMIRETYSALHASEDTLSEVLKVKHQRKSFHPYRVVLIAAVIALALGVTAVAQSAFMKKDDPENMLAAVYSDTETPTRQGRVEFDKYGQMIVYPGWDRAAFDPELADKYVTPYVGACGESMSWQDYTITVEGYLFDSVTRSGILYYRIENPKGIGGYYLQENGEFCWAEESEIACAVVEAGREYIDRDRSTATAVYLSAFFVLTDEEDSAEITLWDAKKQQGSLVVELFDGGGMAWAADRDGTVTVSPIGVRIDLDYFGDEYIANAPQKLTLHYLDSSSYTVYDEDALLYNRMYALQSGSTLTVSFDRVVDVEALSAVEIDGMVFGIAVKTD